MNIPPPVLLAGPSTNTGVALKKSRSSSSVGALRPIDITNRRQKAVQGQAGRLQRQPPSVDLFMQHVLDPSKLVDMLRQCGVADPEQACGSPLTFSLYLPGSKNEQQEAAMKCVIEPSVAASGDTFVDAADSLGSLSTRLYDSGAEAAGAAIDEAAPEPVPELLLDEHRITTPFGAEWQLSVDAAGTVGFDGRGRFNLYFNPEGARQLARLVAPVRASSASALDASELINLLGNYYREQNQAHCAWLDAGQDGGHKLDSDQFRLLYHQLQLARLRLLCDKPGFNSAQVLMAELMRLQGGLLDPSTYLSQLIAECEALDAALLPQVAYLLQLASPWQTASELALVIAAQAGQPDITLAPASSLETADQQVLDRLTVFGLPASTVAMSTYDGHVDLGRIPGHLRRRDADTTASALAAQGRAISLATLADELRRVHGLLEGGDDGALARLLLVPATFASAGPRAPTRLLNWLQAARNLHWQRVPEGLPAELGRFVIQELHAHLLHNRTHTPTHAVLTELLLPANGPSVLLQLLGDLESEGWDQVRLHCVHLVQTVIEFTGLVERPDVHANERLAQLQASMAQSRWGFALSYLPCQDPRGRWFFKGSPPPVTPIEGSRAERLKRLWKHVQRLSDQATWHSAPVQPADDAPLPVGAASSTGGRGGIGAGTTGMSTVAPVTRQPPGRVADTASEVRRIGPDQASGHLRPPVSQRSAEALARVRELSEDEPAGTALVRVGTIDNVRYIQTQPPPCNLSQRLRLATPTFAEQAGEEYINRLLDGTARRRVSAGVFNVEDLDEALYRLSERDVRGRIATSVLEETARHIEEDRRTLGTDQLAYTQIRADLNRSRYTIDGNPIKTAEDLQRALAGQRHEVISFVIHAAHQAVFSAHESKILQGEIVFEDPVQENKGVHLITLGQANDRNRFTTVSYDITLPDGESIALPRIEARRSKQIGWAFPSDFDLSLVDLDVPQLIDSRLEVNLVLTLDDNQHVVVAGEHALRIRYPDRATPALLELRARGLDAAAPDTAGAVDALQRYEQALRETAQYDPHTPNAMEQVHRGYIETVVSALGRERAEVSANLMNALSALNGRLINAEDYRTEINRSSQPVPEGDARSFQYKASLASPFETARNLLAIACEAAGYGALPLMAAASVDDADERVKQRLLEFDLPQSMAALRESGYHWSERGLPLPLQVAPRPEQRLEAQRLQGQALGLVAELREEYQLDKGGLGAWLLQAADDPSDAQDGTSRLVAAVRLAAALYRCGVRSALPDELARFSLACLVEALDNNTLDAGQRVTLAALMPSLLKEVASAPSGHGWTRVRGMCVRLARAAFYGGADARTRSAFKLAPMIIPMRLIKAFYDVTTEYPDWRELQNVAPLYDSLLGWTTRTPHRIAPAEMIAADGVPGHLQLMTDHAQQVLDALCT